MDNNLDPQVVRHASGGSMLGWHVARTEPMKGFIAERQLTDNGFNVFYPKVKEEKRWSRGRTHESVKPLVAGYLFVNFDVDIEGWQKVNDARGIVGLMYSGPEIPARIPDSHMVPLLGMCVDGYVPKAEAQRFVFKVGSIARIINGPFESFSGPVMRASFDKIKVTISVFGRNTNVEGSPSMFVPVG